ncbi:energy-coupling factor transporter transmembrane protein EcfT [Anaerococcus sp. AGMB00486]|uniref:Energy-coupling factor transporter transmembrane protein EcfT n=2 Tax=Anaerococcus TaxID=165779 RepID=A0ABX2NA47_9FIRM|nr:MULTISPECIES: energy-coupling factor transporter transmembrane component T [Anaerococcus]MDY3006718.1 energy-coupling factor transporter transmembrane component T [Anaerococcus porci]MSS77715.1 energy-coupling factor transporter transmembrane protein EcfT [Anaerococcus porci]NVF11571.1 energy-coupling factor transporter transmembrane protein EcfT [Anaerococcus faecalis]
MRFDFRSKLFMTLVVGFIATEGTLSERYGFIGLSLALFPFFLSLFDKNYSFFIRGVIFYSLVAIYPILLRNFKDNILIVLIGIYVMIGIKIMPIVMMTYYSITTTKMSDLVKSLQKMKVPDPIIIPISVMFRFFYSIREDKKTIKEAMYMHGITMRNFFKDPGKFLEYKFVPLLMITSQTADNVAISAMTRGMKIGYPRTSISKTRIKLEDFFLISFGIFLLALYIGVKYVGI